MARAKRKKTRLACEKNALPRLCWLGGGEANKTLSEQNYNRFATVRSR